MKKINKLIALSLFSSSVLLGATPNIGNIEKQIKTPKLKKEVKDIPQVKLEEYKKPMADSGKKIFIKSFIFRGNIHISTNILLDIVKEYKNKELTFKQITQLTSKITKLYREKGYFVARAYIPKQKMKDNILEIDIIEGNYGKFRLKNNSLVKDSIVQSMLDEAKRDNIISTSTLERSMLIINDTAGVVVTKADVMPGEIIGTSDFEIETQASKRFDGYVLADNEGSRYTGKNRLMAGVNLNSPLNIGDKLSLSGLLSDKTDLKNGRVAYLAPLMPNGLKGEVSYSKTTYALGKEYEALDAKGNSQTLEIKLSYPIIRTKLENLFTSVSLIRKDLKDEIDSTNDETKKDLKAVHLGLDYDKSYLAYGLPSSSTINFTFTRGDLKFKDDAKKVADETGANTYGSYSKINLDFTHNIGFNPKLSLETSLKLQYALGHKNLDGSEDMSIGGAYGVKLYPDSEISAENGYLFNIEAKYKLPNINSFSNSIGVFYDRGRVFMADNTVGFESRTLQDVGIGYYASYQDFFGQVQAAWKIDNEDVTSEPDRNSKILFQAGWVF